MSNLAMNSNDLRVGMMGGDPPGIEMAERALRLYDDLPVEKQTRFGNLCAEKTMDNIDAFNEAGSASGASVAYAEVIKWAERLVGELERIKGVKRGGMET